MAIIVDPDNLDRFEVIFGTAPQAVSIYPVGSTQRNTTTAYTDAWVDTTGELERVGGFSGGGVVAGDVASIMNTANAGHFYVNAVADPQATLTDVDAGTAGAATTNLTTNFNSFDSVADVDPGTDQITITAHGYVTGDRVVLDDDGGTAPTGLTDGVVYYVIRVDANTIQLASTFANAEAGTQIDITADGTGTQKLHERVVVAFFTNGANTDETVGGLDTSGDGTGTVLDGISLQTIYSYSKEEWRLDSIENDDFNGNYDADDYFDDLIRHEFPYEAITSEQMEIGGGSAHADWTWFNNYTRKKVRTGGWAERNTANTVLAEWTGVITLGFLDPDTQVYYQQSAGATPIDFDFLGPVNEAIQTFEDGGADNRGFLRLFARKKGRTYAGSQIADIGVTTIQTIVNRFPLAHANDPAIVANDANILGTTPWRNTHQINSGTDGDKTAGGNTFTSAGSTFQTDGLVAGDTLEIQSGTEQGFYTISSVDSETALTIADDFEFDSATGWSSTENTLTFQTLSYISVASKATGTASDFTTGVSPQGIIETGTSGVGEITDTDNASFLGAGAGNVAVVAGDFLWITSSVGNNGLYKVLDSSTTGASDPTVSTIFVDTTDQPFPATREGSVSYQVLRNGMYLQFKEEQIQADLTSSATDTFTFSDANPDTITLAGGNTWDAAVGPGTMLEVTGTANNNGRFTVATRDSSTVVTLVSTDELVTETFNTTGATITVDEGFERDIGGTIFAYRWRVWGNNATLANIFQFIQHQLRQDTDIDFGGGTSRGDVTDLLMQFSTPTGTTLDMFIDDLVSADINNATFQDHSGTDRNFPFTAAGTLNFNDNLVNDANARYWLFFTNDNAGDNLGRDYSTKDAIIVDDADGIDIQGTVTASTVNFTYDYDNNVQRGSASAGVDAPVTLVAIGLDTAQFVISTGTITRSTAISISAVAALERNYSNPA